VEVRNPEKKEQKAQAQGHSKQESQKAATASNA
jgi:hypothetical protein